MKVIQQPTKGNMTLLAKNIVKNKCWLVERDGVKYGTILANEQGVTLIHGNSRERFASLKLLKDKYNIVVDRSKTPKPLLNRHEVNGYPCEHRPHNVLWEVQKKLPIFTKSRKSKSYFCAGYYLVKFNNGWVKSFCPKLITLNRYPFQGPFTTQEEMMEKLKAAHGLSTNTTSQEL